MLLTAAGFVVILPAAIGNSYSGKAASVLQSRGEHSGAGRLATTWQNIQDLLRLRLWPPAFAVRNVAWRGHESALHFLH